MCRAQGRLKKKLLGWKLSHCKTSKSEAQHLPLRYLKNMVLEDGTRLDVKCFSLLNVH